ncbi:hypothetical protein K461DRAFT_274748 [Myriangium duriaei CBS 260.36]|uniref:Apple domain-containing protein n=1 Tax=Myriangium duriaei CBS 260.36 TaxID=1168546 RepID=A0A9P4MJV8_9PEZI|nr:hypothetical protein K461DRAFT_274748 [Myriangium duriaei CBS 260.36]
MQSRVTPEQAARFGRRDTATSFTDCNTQCSWSYGCVAFTYYEASGQCTLYQSLSGSYAAVHGSQFGLAQPQRDAMPKSSTTDAGAATATASGSLTGYGTGSLTATAAGTEGGNGGSYTPVNTFTAVGGGTTQVGSFTGYGTDSATSTGTGGAGVPTTGLGGKTGTDGLASSTTKYNGGGGGGSDGSGGTTSLPGTTTVTLYPTTCPAPTSTGYTTVYSTTYVAVCSGGNCGY